jgi:hypothetical protein
MFEEQEATQESLLLRASRKQFLLVFSLMNLLRSISHNAASGVS